jgi:rRNA-processing protein FCF1
MLKQHRDLEAEIKTAIPGPTRTIVLDLVVLELERLVRGSGNVRTWANAALAFLANGNSSIVEHRPGPTDVDASLVQFALGEKSPTAIATIDRQLRAVLDSFDIPAISPRARYGLIAKSLRL